LSHQYDMVHRYSIILFLFFYFPLYADEIVTAQFSMYNYNDGIAFKIHLYRKCSSPPLQNKLVIYTLRWPRNSGTPIKDSVTANIYSAYSKLVSPFGACLNSNTKENTPGYEMLEYQSGLSLSNPIYADMFDSTRTDSLLFYVEHCCRESGFSNIEDGKPIYLYKKIYVKYFNTNLIPCTPNESWGDNMVFASPQNTEYHFGAFYGCSGNPIVPKSNLQPLRLSNGYEIKYRSPYSWKYPITPYCPGNTGPGCPASLATKPIQGINYSSTIAYFYPGSMYEKCIVNYEYKKWFDLPNYSEINAGIVSNAEYFYLADSNYINESPHVDISLDTFLECSEFPFLTDTVHIWDYPKYPTSIDKDDTLNWYFQTYFSESKYRINKINKKDIYIYIAGEANPGIDKLEIRAMDKHVINPKITTGQIYQNVRNGPLYAGKMYSKKVDNLGTLFLDFSAIMPDSWDVRNLNDPNKLLSAGNRKQIQLDTIYKMLHKTLEIRMYDFICGSQVSEFLHVDSLALGRMPKLNLERIYPVPVISGGTLTVTDTEIDIQKAELFTKDGKLFCLLSSQKNKVFLPPSLSNGMYVLRIHTPQKYFDNTVLVISD